MAKTRDLQRRNEAPQSGAKRNEKQIPFPDDRERDPKIGQSKGAFATGEDPELIEVENTVEGDVQNDSTYGGGADPRQLGRTNE